MIPEHIRALDTMARAFIVAGGAVGSERIAAIKTRRIVGGDLVYAETKAGEFPLGILRYRKAPLIHNGRKPRRSRQDIYNAPRRAR